MIPVFRLAAAGALALTATATAALAARGGVPEGAPEERAYFAMGCFWCAEADFEKLPGVYEAVSGYAGGTVPEPTYEQVTAGGTGHYESVSVSYDPRKLTYQDLLDVFWHNIDPFDAEGQFCDKGDSYRSAIFPTTAEERRLANESKRVVTEALGRPVATEIVSTRHFYPAEPYHQDYYRKNPLRYKFYRTTCGRDGRLAEVWGGG